MADEAYIRWVEDGNVEGPFEDAETAEEWALDQGGPDGFKVVYEEDLNAEELTRVNTATYSTVTLTIRATGLHEDDAIRAVENALEAYNGEAFRVGTLEIIG